MAQHWVPYGGFHQSMRALPECGQRQPDCPVLIAGGDKISDGKKPDGGLNYRKKYWMKCKLAKNSVHFLGELSYADY